MTAPEPEALTDDEIERLVENDLRLLEGDDKPNVSNWLARRYVLTILKLTKEEKP